MRSLDKIVLMAGAAVLVLVLALEIAATVKLKMGVASAADQARQLASQVETNNLPPRPQDPAAFSGKLFSAWENPPISIEPFDKSDFGPNNPVAPAAPVAPTRPATPGRPGAPARPSVR